ncbi:nestin [Ictidomys tridecemlineatus]
MEGCLGEESFQLWELNRRLEAYLARVKALEEQNELLSAELGGLRAQSGDTSWRARADDELAALRALVDQRWREKYAAEVERDNLAEELEGVAGRCQQLRLARERASEEAARSRRAVEAEQCARGWLSAQAAELERELDALRAAHDEERASLNAQAACAPRVPARPRGPPAPAPEVEELARRLGDAWRGAVRGYQERVAHMEMSLGQARERLGRAVQGAREGRLELQQLQTERSGLQERRETLEQRLEGRWQERLRATEKFQLAVEALEQEKQGLQSQIAQVLEGRQQLAHLKMSLSLEVATYRTLLEAENSRLQTPGGSSKASLSFPDPKPELHFPGTPEGRRLGPLLPVLSPTALPSPLPNALETPVPAFLKSHECLQAPTPALASTPIPPTPQASCPATNVAARAQDAPVSSVQPQGESQQAPELVWAEARGAVPASILPGPQEPGGKQPEASTSQSPENQSSLAPPLGLDHPSLEAKDGEPSGSIASSRFQEESEGQVWGLVETEAATEVHVVRNVQQKTWPEEGDLDMKEIQDRDPLEKETLKTGGIEIPEPQMSLENQSHEALEKEDQESLRSLEEENLETRKDLENKNPELLKSLEEKDLQLERPLEKEAPELPRLIGKEDSQTLQSLEKENQELMMSLEGNLETVLFAGKEYQESVKSPEEEKLESLGALKEENQQPLGSEEPEDQGSWGSLPKENQEFLGALENENQETFRPPGKENQEPPKALEEEDQKIVRPLEKENQEPLRYLEEEDQKTVRPLEKENQEPLRYLEEEDGKTLRPLEKENQEPLRYLEEEDGKTVRPLEKENQEPLRYLEEEEDQKTVRPLEKEIQEPLWSLEEEDQKVVIPLEKETQQPQSSLEKDQGSIMPPEKEDQECSSQEEDQETLRHLEKETQQPSAALGEEEQMTWRSLEKVDPESLKSLGKDQEIVRSLEKENQELSKSPKEESGEAMGSLETKNLEPFESAEEENLEILKCQETQEPLWSLEETNKETIKPVEKKIQEPLASAEENQETPRPLEKETQEPLRSLGEWDLENPGFPKEAEKESPRDQEEEERLEKGETQESLKSLGEEGQEPPWSTNQRWEDRAVGDQALSQEAPPGRLGVGSEDEAEPDLREQDGEEEVAQPEAPEPNVTGGTGSPGSPGPGEQSVPAEGARGKGDTEGLQDAAGPAEPVGAPGLGASPGKPGGTEPPRADEGEASEGDLEVAWGPETARGEAAVGAKLAPEQEVMGLEDPGHQAGQEGTWPPLGEEGSGAERAQLFGKDREEADVLGTSRDPPEPPKDLEGSESEAPWGAEEGSPVDTSGRGTFQPQAPGSEESEDVPPALGPPSPRPPEPWRPTPVLGDAPGPQPQDEGSLAAGWGLEGGAEALRKVQGEQEELGPGDVSEDPQEEGEESREESEADELGETLPDSTPLGLYLQSPASPRWDMAGEQRPSPLGEARKEGWDPTALVSKGPGAQPSEEEEEAEEEEEEEEEEEGQGQDSDLSEEFEDLVTEAALLPGDPRELAEPLGQVPQMPKPEVWDGDGESDGFADEEEGGEEGEEEEEEEEEGRGPGAPRWGPGASVSSLQTLSSSQRGDLLEPETVGVSVPWDHGLKASVTALETESQDSAEPSGSEEESDSAPLEREDPDSGPLQTPRGEEAPGPRAGDALSVNGGDHSLEEEPEDGDGRVMNGLQPSQGTGQGTPEAPDGDREVPLQEEEGVALKTPRAGAPVHLGPGRFLKFAPREGEGDSWSSGED